MVDDREEKCTRGAFGGSEGYLNHCLCWICQNLQGEFGNKVHPTAGVRTGSRVKLKV